MDKNKTVLRRWGYYQTLKESTNYKVKYICILPGKSISLQYHNHRTEEWLYISGKGFYQEDEFTEGFRCCTWSDGDAPIFIGKKQKHKITNVGTTNLEFIEIQRGDILSEDDIIRLEEIEGTL